MTADDVLFAFAVAADPRHNLNVQADVAPIASVEAPDASTIVFTLKYPYGPFLTNVGISIMPKALVEPQIADGTALPETPFVGLLANLALSVPTFGSRRPSSQSFAVSLKWLPAGGMTDPGMAASLAQVARHLVLPVIAVAFGPLWAGCARVMAAATAEAAAAPC